MSTLSARPSADRAVWWADDGQHPDWCAKGHHCGLDEHRAAPIVLHVPGRGRIVLVRVMAADGRQHVEIRTRVALADGNDAARAHLAQILAELDAHLTRIIRRPVRRAPAS